MNIKTVVGIDEVGRGPLAGPVVIGVAALHHSAKVRKLFRHLGTSGQYRDSKQLRQNDRHEVVALMQEAEKNGWLSYTTARITPVVIDRMGIAPAIRLAMSRGLKRLRILNKASIVLDGSLYAPAEFTRQQTIIKGDTKELSICLASIVAKVTRDDYMIRQAKKYPHYGFERHKGYGTQYHRDALVRYGCCPIHRKSFIKKYL